MPKENLVGPLNEGWKVAITTLMFERSGAGGRDHAAQIARLVELAKQFPNRQEPAWRESHIRQQLAQLAIDAKALQVTRLRGLTRRLRGEPPGPEGSILKLFGSELAQRIADFSSTLLGPYATLDGPTEAVARRAALGAPRARRPAIHDRRRHQRDPAQHHRRARAGPAEGVGKCRVRLSGHAARRSRVRARPGAGRRARADGAGAGNGARRVAGVRRRPPIGRQERRHLVRKAGKALWMFMVQREACGLRDGGTVARDYNVPAEVLLQSGCPQPVTYYRRRHRSIASRVG